MDFAELPDPPYYAVIFASQLTPDPKGYDAMAEAMLGLAQEQPGYLGFEAARRPDGFGITTAYFTDDAAIVAWKNNVRHLAAQSMGQKRWYQHYKVRVARVERAYGGPEGR